MTYLTNDEVVFKDSPANDAFGRLRVSQPYTLFDSQLQYDKAPDLWDEQTTGAASTTHLSNEAAVQLAVTATPGDKVVRQSRVYNRYQPGKSLMILCTGVLGTQISGIVKRVGYFDTDNGLIFQLDGQGVNVVRRSKTSGTPMDTVVSQANWNLDRMDGTGRSGINLDFTKSQIFMIDLEWLGVGRVRMGFVVDGKVFYCHEFNNANNLGEVYMSTANLPVRYEIENVSASSGDGTMKQICTSVVSEGGYNPRGYMGHTGTGSIKSVSGTLVPLMTIRLKSQYAKSQLVPLQYQLLNTANSYVRYEVIVNGQINSTNWVSASQAVECVRDATTISGGQVIAGGLITNRDDDNSSFDDALLGLGVNIDGTVDTLTLAAVCLSGNASVYATITWKEIR